MPRFTCGEWKICSTIKKYQNIMIMIVSFNFKKSFTHFMLLVSGWRASFLKANI